MSETNYAQALHNEIEKTPVEYLGALLNIVHTFRESVSQLSPEQSLEQGLKEAIAGDTHHISTLWDGIDAE
jgi:hypothetical protein